MNQHGNAEASSSRLPRSIAIRRKSQDALKKANSQPLSRVTSPVSVVTASGQPNRAVKTIPPFEPPTPPTPADDTLPETTLHKREKTGATTSTRATHKRRRAPRVRYDTSDSSADSTDAETSDEEPPWWTFTQRGMAKMRARTMRKGEEGVSGISGVSGAESGKDSGKEHRGRRGSRQNSKEKKETPTSSRPSSIHRLQAAAHIRPAKQAAPNSLLWRRSVGRDTPLPPISLPTAAPMARTHSAPTSPLRLSEEMAASPGMTTIVGSTDEPRLSESLLLIQPDRPVSSRRPILSPKRQLTAPTFPRFLKRSDQDIHTDTEAGGSTAPRAKVREKERLRNVAENTVVSSSAPSRPSEEGASTPTRPRGQRRATNRLKISLPDPITQHFAEGWQKGRPHAGTWQDAYYGHYPQHQNTPEEHISSVAGSIHSASAPKETSSRRSSVHKRSRRPSKGRLPTPEHSERSVPPSPAYVPNTHATHTARKRSRRVKGRRYRQAIAPPTPSGLGFTPNGSRRDSDAWKEGRVGASTDGYNWQNSHSEPVTASDELDRSETTVTNEKSSPGGSAKKSWLPFIRRRARPNDRREDIGWRKKTRRMLFLDARVTIWIRLVNLAFVATSLALAVRIRLQLDELRVPGLMGASTTLLIAFSTLTALHVLTAIYREYFGKPIGLWGLRSKMLWVCLDLAFIGFWSSSASLALNDYLSTPLQCTSDTPWWRSGLAQDYAALLENLQLPQAALTDITPADLISHSLGIILPFEITNSPLAHQICDKQIGSIVLALITLLLYTGNMVLSLFRIFETVRRTANVDRAVMV